MARKNQKDYLTDLLADDKGQVASEKNEPTRQPESNPRGTRGSGMALLGRESALARVASGEVRQVTQLRLDPAKVRIWSGNARMQERINEDNARELINSIIAEGGQKVPAIVRHVEGDRDHDYEVIAGTRRHFAISWLRANSYPDMTLLAEVKDLDDEAAFRLADIENRARQDVSEIERARNYAAALKDHYGSKQRRMAERLKLSEGWLSKMLKTAALPDQILAAFPDLHEITLNPAYKLAQAVAEPKRAPAILGSADIIAKENEARQSAGQQPLAASAILARLIKAGEKEQEPPKLFEGLSKQNRPALSVTSTSRQGLIFKVFAASGADEDEMVALFRQALTEHEFKPELKDTASE